MSELPTLLSGSFNLASSLKAVRSGFNLIEDQCKTLLGVNFELVADAITDLQHSLRSNQTRLAAIQLRLESLLRKSSTVCNPPRLLPQNKKNDMPEISFFDASQQNSSPWSVLLNNQEVVQIFPHLDCPQQAI
jgi:hypothetical protein